MKHIQPKANVVHTMMVGTKKFLFLMHNCIKNWRETWLLALSLMQIYSFHLSRSRRTYRFFLLSIILPSYTTHSSLTIFSSIPF
jgi:hypothetical protein